MREDEAAFRAVRAMTEDAQTIAALRQQVEDLQAELEQHRVTLARALSSDLEAEEGADWHSWWRVARDEAARKAMLAEALYLDLHAARVEKLELAQQVEDLTRDLRYTLTWFDRATYVEFTSDPDGARITRALPVEEPTRGQQKCLTGEWPDCAEPCEQPCGPVVVPSPTEDA